MTTKIANLNPSLSEPLAPKLRITLASVVMENLIDRTLHESKRAKADVIVSMSLLKAYEAAGGSL
jgi:hypothetical protein